MAAKRDDEIQPSSIRIDATLKAAVTRRAEAQSRTFSQHVIHLLREHVRSTPEPEAEPKTSRRRAS